MSKIDIPKKNLKFLYKKKKLTTYQIADIYNCCQATIWKRLHEFNIKSRLPWNLVDLPKKKLRNLYIKKNLSTWEIEKQYGYPRSTVHRNLREYNIKTRNIAESHIIYPRKDFSGGSMEKAYLMGFAIGDLRARKIGPKSETIHIDCGSTKLEQIALIKKLFKPYGKVWISKPNKKGAIQIEAMLNDSFAFLLKKGLKIDKWILKDNNYFISFLAGFTDAEGSIIVSGSGQAVYQLGNYNKNLLKQIRGKLIELGIVCPKLYSDSNKGYIDKEGYVRNDNYWSLRICRKFYLSHLLNLLTPHIKHLDKKKGINKVKNNISKRNKRFGNINMNIINSKAI